MKIEVSNKIIGQCVWNVPHSVQSFLAHCKDLEEKHPNELKNVSGECEEEIKKWIDTLLSSIAIAYDNPGKTEPIYHLINAHMVSMVVDIRRVLEGPAPASAKSGNN